MYLNDTRRQPGGIGISKDPTLEGLGVARQLKDGSARAQLNGWRVIEEFEDWTDLAAATGINIHSATNGHIDLSTPDGRTMARVITAFAAEEVEKAKMRLLKKASLTGRSRRLARAEVQRLYG